MKTDCTPEQLEFQGLGKKKILVNNEGEETSTDGGILLLQTAEQYLGIIDKLAECFTDRRAQWAVIHPLKDLLKQRIFGLAQGYEDLNDHEIWRSDPLLRSICGKGENPLAGKSTLNRLELGMETQDYGDRYTRFLGTIK